MNEESDTSRSFLFIRGRRKVLDAVVGEEVNMVLYEAFVSAILPPRAHVLRRSIAECIVDIEVFGEPLAHIFVGKFASDVA